MSLILNELLYVVSYAINNSLIKSYYNASYICNCMFLVQWNTCTVYWDLQLGNSPRERARESVRKYELSESVRKHSNLELGKGILRNSVAHLIIFNGATLGSHAVYLGASYSAIILTLALYVSISYSANWVNIHGMKYHKDSVVVYQHCLFPVFLMIEDRFILQNTEVVFCCRKIHTLRFWKHVHS